MNVNKCFLVGVDITDEDNAVIIVGEKTNKVDVKIINAFKGKEALELYKKLITKEEKNES